jgi:hypothetical protein
MNRKLLILSVAALAVAATGASATTHKHHRMARENYAPPPQPIPYAELDSYVGGSHHGQMAQAGSSPMANMSSSPSTSPAPAADATPPAPAADATAPAAPPPSSPPSAAPAAPPPSSPPSATPGAAPPPQ